MAGTITIYEYTETVRHLYKTETMPLVKGYWLKLGITIKAAVDAGEYDELDPADDQFEKRIYEKMEEK